MVSHEAQTSLYGKGHKSPYKGALYILRKDFIKYISGSVLVSRIYVELKNENQEDNTILKLGIEVRRTFLNDET